MKPIIMEGTSENSNSCKLAITPANKVPKNMYSKPKKPTTIKISARMNFRNPIVSPYANSAHSIWSDFQDVNHDLSEPKTDNTYTLGNKLTECYFSVSPLNKRGFCYIRKPS